MDSETLEAYLEMTAHDAELAAADERYHCTRLLEQAMVAYEDLGAVPMDELRRLVMEVRYGDR
jgi:hypothetical protein